MNAIHLAMDEPGNTLACLYNKKGSMVRVAFIPEKAKKRSPFAGIHAAATQASSEEGLNVLPKITTISLPKHGVTRKKLILTRQEDKPMTSYPVHIEGEGAQAAYHVVPDPVRGGWNVYATNQPQEPQQHFGSKEQAVAYAESLCAKEGVGFSVADFESPAQGH